MRFEGIFVNKSGEQVNWWFEAPNQDALEKHLSKIGWKAINFHIVGDEKFDLKKFFVKGDDLVPTSLRNYQVFDEDKTPIFFIREKFNWRKFVMQRVFFYDKRATEPCLVVENSIRFVHWLNLYTYIIKDGKGCFLAKIVPQEWKRKTWDIRWDLLDASGKRLGKINNDRVGNQDFSLKRRWYVYWQEKDKPVGFLESSFPNTVVLGWENLAVDFSEDLENQFNMKIALGLTVPLLIEAHRNL